MTASELIKALQSFPGDAVVVVNMGRNELANGFETYSAKLVNATRYVAEGGAPYGCWAESFNGWHDPTIQAKPQDIVNIEGRSA